MARHSDIVIGGNHILHNFTYANAAARNAAVLAATDVGKVALQLDNSTFWVLNDDAPLTWTQLDSSGGTVFADNVFAVQDNGDATKQLNVQLAGATTGTTSTLVSSQTANRNVTLPDATTTLVGTDFAQTLTNKTMAFGANTFTGFPTAFADNVFAVQDDGDATKQLNVQLSGATTGTTSTITASQSANRVITLPNATTTLVGTDFAQTLTNKTMDYNSNTFQNFPGGSTVYAWAGYHSKGSDGWTRAASSDAFFEMTGNDSATFNETYNTNFGVVTSRLSSVNSQRAPGISFTPPVNGLYMVTMNTSMRHSVAQDILIRMITSTPTVIIEGHNMRGQASGQACPVTLSGIISLTTGAAIDIYLQMATRDGSGTLQIGTIPNAATEVTREITYSIFKIN